MKKLYLLIVALMLAGSASAGTERIKMLLTEVPDTIVFLRVENGVNVDSTLVTGTAAAAKAGVDTSVSTIAGISTKFIVRIVFLGLLTASKTYEEHFGFDPGDMATLVDLNWDELITPGTHNIDSSSGKILQEVRFYMDTLIYIGERGPGIFVDSTAGNTNTVLGVDGTEKNPVSTIAAARTLALALGAHRFYFHGGSTFNGATTDLNADYSGWEFYGNGFGIELAFGGQLVTNSFFKNIKLSGAMHPSGGNVFYLSCELAFISSNFQGHAAFCELTDTIVTKAAADVSFAFCFSGLTPAHTPTIDLGPGANLVSINHYSGGIRIMNGSSNDSVTITTNGQVIISANNTSLTIKIHGMVEINDSGTTTNITKDAVFSRAEADLWVWANVDTTLTIDTSNVGGWLTTKGDTAIGGDERDVVIAILRDSLNAAHDSLKEYDTRFDSLLAGVSDAAKGAIADSVKEMARYNSNLFMAGFELNLIRNPSFEVDSVETPTAPFGWVTTTHATDSFLTNGASRRSGKWGLDLDGDAAGDSAFLFSTPFMLEERSLLKYGASWTGGGSDSFYIVLQARTSAPVTWTSVDSIVARGSSAAGNFAGFSGWNTMTNQYEIVAADSALPFRMMLRFNNGTNVWTLDDVFAYAYPGQLAQVEDSSAFQGAAGGVNLADVWRNQDTTNVDSSDIGLWLVNNLSAAGSTDTTKILAALRGNPDLFESNSDGFNLVVNGAFDEDTVLYAASTDSIMGWKNGVGTHTLGGLLASDSGGRALYAVTSNAVNDTVIVYELLGSFPKGIYWMSARMAKVSGTNVMLVLDDTIPTHEKRGGKYLDSLVQTVTSVSMAINGKFVELTVAVDSLYIGMRVTATAASQGGRFDDIIFVPIQAFTVLSLGDQSIVIGATDTAGADINTLVSKVSVTLRDAGGSQIGQKLVTNGAGYVTANLTTGDTITVLTESNIQNAHQFSVVPRTFVVGVTGDTVAWGHSTTPGDSVLPGDDFIITAPALASLVRVWGHIERTNGTGIKNVTVTASLQALNTMDTSRLVILGSSVESDLTDADGLFEIDIVRSPLLSPAQPYFFNAFATRGRRRTVYIDNIKMQTPDSAIWKLIWQN